MYFIWHQVSVQTDVSWPVPAEVSWLLLCSCVALMPVNITLEVSVWRTLLAGVPIDLPFRKALPAVLSGFAAGAVSPGGVGDFVGRVVRVEKSERWITAIAMALGRVADTITLCTAGLVASILILPIATGPTLVWIRTVMIVSVPILVAFVIVYSGHARWSNRDALLSRWPSVQRSVAMASEIPIPIRLTALSLAAVRVCVFVAQLVLVVLATSTGEHELAPLLAAAVLVYLLRALAPPVTFMGLGIREAASVAVFGLIGVSASVALVASLFVFTINIAVPALAGVPFLLFPSWNPSIHGTAELGADSDVPTGGLE